MTIFTDKDEKILYDYLQSYKECFEAMNDLLNKISQRVEFTPSEIELAKISEAKYKNMVYHIRKWTPAFKKAKQ